MQVVFRHSWPHVYEAAQPAYDGCCCADAGGAVGAVDLAHKGVVMRCLEAQCESGQLLVDLFVNYDCDLEGANLFERMVLALVRISQGTPDKDASTPQAQEEEALRLGVRLKPVPVKIAFCFCCFGWKMDRLSTWWLLKHADLTHVQVWNKHRIDGPYTFPFTDPCSPCKPSNKLDWLSSRKSE